MVSFVHHKKSYMSKLAFAVLFLVVGMSGLHAQVNTEGGDGNYFSLANSVDITDESVFMDKEEKICFVDLEKVPVNLKQAAILNSQGD